MDRRERDVDCLGKTGALSTRYRAVAARPWISARLSRDLPHPHRTPKSLLGPLRTTDLWAVHPHIHSPYYDYVFLTPRKIGSTNR